MSYLPLSTPFLDRQAQLRRDSGWPEGLAADQTTVWPVWRSKIVLTAEQTPLSLPVTAARLMMADGHPFAVLGQSGNQTHLAVDLSAQSLENLSTITGAGDLSAADLRHAAAFLSRESLALAGYAIALFSWHRSAAFCGTCGAKTQRQENGHSRLCTGCGKPHFPRLNPAVIMRVTWRDEILLGRNKDWPETMYSLLAGYVEASENLEQAVAREVMEETGVAVENVRYRGSQAWPVSSSVMLGFDAEATGDVRPAVILQDDELEDAQWFTRERLQARIGSGEQMRPFRISIAGQMIAEWLEGGSDD